MTSKGAVIVLATLDTKGAEAAFLAGLLEEHGLVPKVLDLGLLDRPEVEPDITRDTVARAAGTDVAALTHVPKSVAMERMGEGAGQLLHQLYHQGDLVGVIGLGGNQGTAMACQAMQALPLGVPKVMVSTVASGDVRPYIGAKDITMLFAVADILGGPNPVTKSVLRQAASALAGMIAWGGGLELPPGPPIIALTALGNTHPSALRCLAQLKARGYRVVPFHASGACGSAMEELIDEGKIDAVLDLTPHELVGDVLGYDVYRPVRPGRLLAAARRGIPQVVSTGGLDYYCFGPEASIPAHLKARPTYLHNPLNANVALSDEEFARLGEVMAERLSQSKGPVLLVLPRLGWSHYGREGGPFWNPTGRAAFERSLKARLEPNVELLELDAHINDPVVADVCVERLQKMVERALSSAKGGG